MCKSVVAGLIFSYLLVYTIYFVKFSLFLIYRYLKPYKLISTMHVVKHCFPQAPAF